MESGQKNLRKTSYYAARADQTRQKMHADQTRQKTRSGDFSRARHEMKSGSLPWQSIEGNGSGMLMSDLNQSKTFLV